MRSTLLRPVATPTLPPLVGQDTCQLERARGLSAERAARAEVGDDGVVPEGHGVGAALPQLFDDFGAPLAAAHVQRHDRREEAGPRRR